nr:ribosomal protein S3 [Balanophora reflexa]
MNDSIYFYGKLICQDINLRSYFGSIRCSPTRLRVGFRLGRCIIIYFPKRTFIHLFIPRLNRRVKSRSKKCQLWEFRKVPIQYSKLLSKITKQRSEKNGRKNSQKTPFLLSRSILPITIKKIRISGNNKEIYGPFTKYAWVVNDLAFLIEIENYEVFDRKEKYDSFSELFFTNQQQSRSDDALSSLLKIKKRPLPAVRPSLNYSILKYLLNNTCQINIDPILLVLNHFVAPGSTSTMAQKIRSGIVFLIVDWKNIIIKMIITPSIRSDLREGKPTIALFPFLGATFLFIKYYYYKNIIFEDAGEQLLCQLIRVKSRNIIGKDMKLMEDIDKFIDDEVEVERGGIEMMIEILLKNIRIPYGYNSYSNEVKKIRSYLYNYNNRRTETLIESVKIKSVYQSASPIAQDISFQLKNKIRSFRSIFSKIVRDIPLLMKKKGVDGIRVCCSGRLEGTEIAKTECGKYKKTSRNIIFNQKIDYAPVKVSTSYGILGVKVWISYII